MKLQELISNMQVLACTASPELEITAIAYDSRAVSEANLFVAVRGFASDGHRFVPMAKEKGAAAVVCEEVPETDIPYILVKDSRLALAQLACRFYGEPAREMTIIGITGTNGKTTSSYLIKHLLETVLHAKVGLIGTNGNMIGDRFLHSERTTPESLELQKLFREMRDEGCTHVVMEVSSHSLVLSRVAGITFDVALFTNLTQDHLDFHHTMEAYGEAKRRLFAQSRIAAVNGDDPWAEFMTANKDCPFLCFSAQGKETELCAEKIALTAQGVSFDACAGEERTAVKLCIPGQFSVYNALGVLAVAKCLGISLSDASKALGSAKGVKGRVEVVETDGDYSILIDYAHTPDALENVLKTLKPLTRGTLYCLFGCGGDRDTTKRPLMGRIAAEQADYLIVTSDNPRTEQPEAIVADILKGIPEGTLKTVIVDRVEAIHWGIDNARAGDVILLAGKGHEDYQVIGHTKYPMDERVLVADYLKERKKK